MQGRLGRAGQETATEHSADGEGNLHDHAELEKHSGQDHRDGHSHVPQVSENAGETEIL